MSLSVITITQLSRKNCLMNLYELIKLQTYRGCHVEWVIVEGSKTNEDRIKNKLFIDQLIHKHNRFQERQSYASGRLDVINIMINYVNPYINAKLVDSKLSDLRNFGNSWSSGNIIVCMDDDDYYPPDRIDHAVNCLMNSSKLIAGCSAVYMYDYDMQKLYKFDSFGENHSTNNCLAYKRDYLKNHSHAPGLDNGEELSFTNKFTEPMIQLNNIKTIIVSSHNNNTFDKKNMCISGSAGMHDYLHEVYDIPIYEFIPFLIFNKMKLLFDRPNIDIDYSGNWFCNNKYGECSNKVITSTGKVVIDCENIWRM